MLSYCSLAFMVQIRGQFLIILSFCIMHHFSLDAFSICTLALTFISLTMMSLCVDSYVFSYFVYVLGFLHLYINIFHQTWEIFLHQFLNIFLFFFSLPQTFPFLYVGVFYVVPQFFDTLSLFLQSFFPPGSLYWEISMGLSSNSLILSSPGLNPLFSITSEIFHLLCYSSTPVYLFFLNNENLYLLIHYYIFF